MAGMGVATLVARVQVDMSVMQRKVASAENDCKTLAEKIDNCKQETQRHTDNSAKEQGTLETQLAKLKDVGIREAPNFHSSAETFIEFKKDLDYRVNATNNCSNDSLGLVDSVEEHLLECTQLSADVVEELPNETKELRRRFHQLRGKAKGTTTTLKGRFSTVTTQLHEREAELHSCESQRMKHKMLRDSEASKEKNLGTENTTQRLTVDSMEAKNAELAKVLATQKQDSEQARGDHDKKMSINAHRQELVQVKIDGVASKMAELRSQLQGKMDAMQKEDEAHSEEAMASQQTRQAKKDELSELESALEKLDEEASAGLAKGEELETKLEAASVDVKCVTSGTKELSSEISELTATITTLKDQLMETQDITKAHEAAISENTTLLERKQKGLAEKRATKFDSAISKSQIEAATKAATLADLDKQYGNLHNEAKTLLATAVESDKALNLVKSNAQSTEADIAAQTESITRELASLIEAETLTHAELDKLKQEQAAREEKKAVLGAAQRKKAMEAYTQHMLAEKISNVSESVNNELQDLKARVADAEAHIRERKATVDAEANATASALQSKLDSLWHAVDAVRKGKASIEAEIAAMEATPWKGECEAISQTDIKELHDLAASASNINGHPQSDHAAGGGGGGGGPNGAPAIAGSGEASSKHSPSLARETTSFEDEASSPTATGGKRRCSTGDTADRSSSKQKRGSKSNPNPKPLKPKSTRTSRRRSSSGRKSKST